MNRNHMSKRNGLGTMLFAAAWIFVGLAAAFDGGFAWHFRASFQEWELNPLARRLAAGFGMEGLLTFKAAGLIFAVTVASACRRRRHRLAVPLTLVAAAVYLVLSIHYLTSFMPLDGQPAQLIALATR
jgi:hypothetical protein